MRILSCLLLVMLILLSGCGVKGDLYLPEANAPAGAGEMA
ncbi:LPS translocon maturation chaperone LptM [Spiribacter onubensis]